MIRGAIYAILTTIVQPCPSHLTTLWTRTWWLQRRTRRDRQKQGIHSSLPGSTYDCILVQKMSPILPSSAVQDPEN